MHWKFASQYTSICSELKTRMRNHKLRVQPNSKELVINFNRRAMPETISEHNDPNRVDWTEVPSGPTSASECFSGSAALLIPDESVPRYKLFWPLRGGSFNEADYGDNRSVKDDYAVILESAIKTQLGLHRRNDFAQHGCVFIVPDLYDRTYICTILEMLLRDFGFGKVCFLQESVAASFGAGYSISCIVDIGAQKTSVCCVDEGLCIENSRIKLAYGSADVTELFAKMMLYDHFPLPELDLQRRNEMLALEDVQRKVCSCNETDVTVQLHDLYLRSFGQETVKYQFKTYDEPFLAATVRQIRHP